ncbi:MAG TPA: histidine phosphatase family protein [Gaiellaceae bacterium]
MRLFVFARHAESMLNVEGRVNGDPARQIPLTDRGRQQAADLGQMVANVPLDVCIHTRFPRTRKTAEIAISGRGIPMVEEPLFDDIDIGELEGRLIDDYRAWKHEHSRSDPFPGGESLDDAARRYVQGFEGLLARPEVSILAVVHEIPIRYALNGAMVSDSLDAPAHEVPNATPYLFDEQGLERAIAGIERLVGKVAA